MPEELHDQSTIYWISPTGDLGSGAERARDQRPLRRVRLGADASQLGWRRRLLRWRRRRRGRWRRRRLVATGRACGPIRRARSRPRPRRSATRRPRRAGSTRRRRTHATTSLRQPLPLGAEHEDRPSVRARALPSGSPAVRDERDPPPHRLVEAARAGRGRSRRPIRAAPSARSGRRSPRRARRDAPNASAVRISVPTFPGSATCQSASPTGRVLAGGQVGSPEDADHARRVRERRDRRRAAQARRPRRRRAGRRARSRRPAPPRRDPRPRRRTARASSRCRRLSSRRISFSRGLART